MHRCLIAQRTPECIVIYENNVKSIQNNIVKHFLENPSNSHDPNYWLPLVLSDSFLPLIH